MATPPNTKQELEAAVAAFVRHQGNLTHAALELGIPRTTMQHRIAVARQKGLDIVLPEPTKYPGRIVTELKNGTVIVGSDLHAWPGPTSTAFRALVHFVRELKPDIIIKNGDVMDMSKISRHPPLGWSKLPDVREEIEAAQDMLAQVEEAAPPHCRKYWPCGNHDSRYEVRLATVAAELIGVKGTSLRDHFPNWTPCWAVHINDNPGGLVVKHRYKGGVHAPWNNTVYAGRSICTGHLHSQKTTPMVDLNGIRYGIDSGCLADPWGEQFAYMEDNPRNWISGFAIFTFRDGEMMPPELVTVIRPGAVAYRGQLIEV